MNITRNKLFPSLILLQLFVGLLFIFNNNYFLLRTILSFIYFLSVPGLLLLLILKITKTNTYEYFSYMIGLSLSFLIFEGLAINTLLPMLDISKPLSDTPLLIGLNLLILTLIPIAYFKNKNLNLEIKPPNISPLNWALLGSSLLFPALSIFGANILNNDGTNFVAISMIIGIAIYIPLLTILRKKINEKIYPLIILAISVSLLLSYSLRSWHILGWDINEEFKMFQLTKQNLQWTSANAKSIYNTCLSLTILPTILQSITKISDENIFKIIYPIIFSLVPLNIYLISRRYTTYFFSYLISFFFMAQQMFYLQLPAVARQEIGFLFFSTMILVLFNKTIAPLLKNILFLIFGLSLIVSHYSTTYITIILLILTYILVKIFKLIKKIFYKDLSKTKIHDVYYLKLTTIIILIGATILWNSQTKSSYNTISNTANSVISGFGKLFTLEDRSSTLLSFLFNVNNSYTDTELNKFIKVKTVEYLKNSNLDSLTDNKLENVANIHFVTDVYPPHPDTLTEHIIILPYTISKYIILLGLIVGLAWGIYNLIRSRIDLDIEYYLFALSTFILILVMVILPHISVAYNIDRLFQQGLFFTSIFVIIGILKIFDKLQKISTYLLTGIFVIYYLYQSGITAPFTGDIMRVNTFNNGPEYDAHYIHNQDIQGIKWISNNRLHDKIIYSDRLTHVKFYSFGELNIDTIPYAIPNIVDKSGYVFAGYTNTKMNIASIEDSIHKNQSFLYINFPFEFYDENKNLIYNSGGAKIYK